MIRRILPLLAMIPMALACTTSGDALPGMTAVTYQASDAVIPNPERGFYTAQEIYTAKKSGVSKEVAEINRKQGRSLFLLEFHLRDFVNSDISEDYLQTIRTYFASMRDNGLKCVLRFCYSNGFAESDKPWDATPEQVLRHIAQVKPILQEYYDVIFVVQAGFVGSWGEWYYTENFNDNASRKSVVDALLEAVPDCRQIELRTPAFKMSLYGYGPADTITRATAHRPDIKGRLAGHNDCYLANANDQGTYRGNTDRKYWSSESLYTIMGGESCGLSSFCHCQQDEKVSAAHGALADLATFHFTYLNQGYHPSVLSLWRKESCFEEIQKRLGYRYVLEKGQFTKAPQAGSPFRVVLKLHNEGFAPAQNPRDAELVLSDKSGKILNAWPLTSDPRYWMSGETIDIDQTITLPEGISGDMTLSLNLPDPCTNLRNNPYYSIRMANENMWDEKTGFNTLYSFTL